MGEESTHYYEIDFLISQGTKILVKKALLNIYRFICHRFCVNRDCNRHCINLLPLGRWTGRTTVQDMDAANGTMVADEVEVPEVPRKNKIKRLKERLKVPLANN